jgi:hypothetical protein
VANYEAQGIFAGGLFTQAEVEAILAKAKAIFISGDGSQIVSWSSSGQQASSRYALTATETIVECLYALQRLDPTNYPTDPDRSVADISTSP